MLCVIFVGERVYLCIVFEVYDISYCLIIIVVYGVFYWILVWIGIEYFVFNRFLY